MLLVAVLNIHTEILSSEASISDFLPLEKPQRISKAFKPVSFSFYSQEAHLSKRSFDSHHHPPFSCHRLLEIGRLSPGLSMLPI